MTESATTIQFLPNASPPHDWDAIDEVVRTTGGTVVEGLMGEDLTGRLDAEIDAYLTAHPGAGAPRTTDDGYDNFLGHRTIRLHGLTEKLPSAAELIGHEAIVSWSERMMAPLASSVLLSAGELIQIGPGEPEQVLHRDSDSWPAMPFRSAPIIVNAILAMFSLENRGDEEAIVGSVTNTPATDSPAVPPIPTVEMLPGGCKWLAKRRRLKSQSFGMRALHPLQQLLKLKGYLRWNRHAPGHRARQSQSLMPRYTPACLWSGRQRRHRRRHPRQRQRPRHPPGC